MHTIKFKLELGQKRIGLYRKSVLQSTVRQVLIGLLLITGATSLTIVQGCKTSVPVTQLSYDSQMLTADQQRIVSQVLTPYQAEVKQIIQQARQSPSPLTIAESKVTLERIQYDIYQRLSMQLSPNQMLHMSRQLSDFFQQFEEYLLSLTKNT